MASKQLKQMHERYASIKERVIKPRFGNEWGHRGELAFVSLINRAFLPNSKD